MGMGGSPRSGLDVEPYQHRATGPRGAMTASFGPLGGGLVARPLWLGACGVDMAARTLEGQPGAVQRGSGPPSAPVATHVSNHPRFQPRP